MSEKLTGTVKWFNNRKGFGFIEPDDGADDVFVHYSSIVSEGYRKLDEGARVEYAIEETDKGPQAVSVTQL